MKSVREQVLDEEGHSGVYLAVEGTQSGIFSGIFANLEWVVSTPYAKYAFFGAAVFLSILKTFFNIRNYFRRKNRTASKGMMLAINIASTIAEILAVAAAFTGAIMAAATVPLVFVCIMGTNFLSNLAQVFYHGYKWARSESGSHESSKHKARFWGHLRGVGILAVLGTVIGLLLLTPAFSLAVLAATTVVAVKAIGATVVGINAAAILYGVGKAAGSKIVSFFRKDRAPVIQPERQPLLPKQTPVRNKKDFTKDVRLLEKYKQENLFKSLKDNDVDDLIRKLELSAGLDNDNSRPKEILVNLLGQARTALDADLKAGSLFNMQYDKRQDKLFALNILNHLVVENCPVRVEQKNKVIDIHNVQELINHLKKMGQYENVIASVFATDVNQGKMQKLLVLVDHYLQNNHLHPVRYNTHEVEQNSKAFRFPCSVM